MKTLINALNAIELSKTETQCGELEIKGASWCGDYLFKSKTVFNWIEGKCLLLQNGMSYRSNDYNMPCNTLEVSEDGGCDAMFVALNKLSEKEIEEMTDEHFAELSEEFGFESKDQLLEMYLALCDAVSTLNTCFMPRIDIDDFEISRDKETGEYTITEK